MESASRGVGPIQPIQAKSAACLVYMTDSMTLFLGFQKEYLLNLWSIILFNFMLYFLRVFSISFKILPKQSYPTSLFSILKDFYRLQINSDISPQWVISQQYHFCTTVTLFYLLWFIRNYPPTHFVQHCGIICFEFICSCLWSVAIWFSGHIGHY